MCRRKGSLSSQPRVQQDRELAVLRGPGARTLAVGVTSCSWQGDSTVFCSQVSPVRPREAMTSLGQNHRTSKGQAHT